MPTQLAEAEGGNLRADARRNRTRVLAAAVGRFAAEGIGASLEDIARDAGVGAGTLYRHFPSREALIAAALRESLTALLARADGLRTVAHAGEALQAWLAALQEHLRTFGGLPTPVLAAIHREASPLSLSCDALVGITGEFLARAQADGHARRETTASEVFLATLGLAWVVDRAEACGITRAALERLLAYGYLEGA